MKKDPKHLLFLAICLLSIASGCSLIDGVPNIGADDNNETNNTTANNGNGPARDDFVGHWEITDGDEGGVVVFDDDGTGIGNGEFFLESLRDKSGCEDVASWGFTWEVEYEAEGSDVILMRMTIEQEDVDFLSRDLECDAQGYIIEETVELTRGGTNLEINAGPTLERFKNDFTQVAFEDNLNFIRRGTPIQLLNIGHSTETDTEQILSVDPDPPEGNLPQIILVEDDLSFADNLVWNLTPLGSAQNENYSFLQNQDSTLGDPNSVEGSDGSVAAFVGPVSESSAPTGTIWAARFEGRCNDLGLDCPDVFGGPSGLVFKLRTILSFSRMKGSLTYDPEEERLFMEPDVQPSGSEPAYQFWLMRPVDL